MNETVVGSTTDRYQYTGKERDKETGLDYFGARYYDSDLGIWHSVDPMADKYPGWSTYNYCLGNPVGYTDPNGMRVPTRDSSGNIIVTSVDGDTYEDLYTQLGMTPEQFAAFAAKQGIKLSLDCSGMSFDITSIVLIQRNISSDNLNMNCFSSGLYGTGAYSEEIPINHGFNFTQFAQEKLGYKKISDAQPGSMVTWQDNDDITHHAAIFVIKGIDGTDYYVGRPGRDSEISIQNSTVTSRLYPGFQITNLKYNP